MTKRPIYKFFAALLTAAMLTVLLPTTASAFTGYNMANRTENLIITSGEYPYVIDGSSTQYGIIVNAPGQTVNITFESVSIQKTGAYEDVALKIEAGTVNLTLTGDNFLRGGRTHAGIENGENTLNISGPGTLTAQGGTDAAGIGGGPNGNGSNITINGGTIIAKGGKDGAGIGSGSMGAKAENITINGGTVTAIGGYRYGAGIGGGNMGTANNIIINGGSVKATKGYFAKNDIGGGNSNAAVTPKNSSGADLMLTTKASLSDTDISCLAGLSYNMAGANAINEIYYLYLPKYGITYNNTDGATHSNPSEYNVLSGITLSDADKSAYVFKGWFDAETGGNKVTVIPEGSTGDKVLYANWSAMPVLESIQPLASISDIKNGTAKTVAALGLPSTVTLVTDSGSVKANVQANITWNMDSCLYDPSLASEQTFMVSGTVTLPDGILNTHNIGLTAGITVSVNAAPTYGIGLSQSGAYTFPAQTPEYSSVSPLSVTVSNAGNQATGGLTVALGGTGKDSFTLSKTNIGSIAKSGSDSFTVKPNDSLTAGTYAATVTVSGGNSITKSFDISFTVSEAPTYSIDLSQSSAYTFPAQTAGYSPVSPLSITVSNTGNQATGALTLALSGTGKDSFTLSKTDISSIAKGGADNFTVKPNDSLTVGTYTATVTVSGANSITKSFDVSFTVNKASTGGGSSGSGSGGSSGSGSSNNSSITVTADAGTTTAAQTVSATTGTNGVAAANVTKDQIADMMKVAKRKAQEQNTQTALEIKVNSGSTATGVSVTLPQGVASSLTDGVDALTISSPVVTVTFDEKALAEINKDTTGDITVTARKPADTALSDADKAIIGSRPVYDLKVTSGDTAISTFGGGSATVRIPYTPAAGEDTNKIVVYYISGSGELVMVPGCAYNASTGTVTFKTTHFSSYAVGYNDVSFSDVSGWYETYVNYLAARGIVGGTGNGTFSPEANITRAEFVTILANLSGNDLSDYTSSTFSDVSASNWYFAAVQWANKNGIASGYDGAFNPNANITREQMAVMLFNYAKYAGIDVSDVEGMSVREFSDYGSISNWALKPIQWAINNSIVSGNSDGSFATQANATRAQAAKMIAVLLQGMIGS